MEGNDQSESASPAKNLFRIGEVSRLTSTKAFVLRYWETEFPMLQPVKSPKGHRLYRRQDIETVFLIKRLLYDEGFTIAGARRHLLEQGGSNGAATDEAHVEHPSLALNRKTLLDLRDSLRSFLTLLEHE
jgi:DNA-binding transcriptional MerR regulator